MGSDILCLVINGVQWAETNGQRRTLDEHGDGPAHWVTGALWCTAHTSEVHLTELRACHSTSDYEKNCYRALLQLRWG